MARIHPTALVDPGAEIADDAEIGAYCVVDGDTVVGAGCVLRPHAVVRCYTRLGRGNRLDSFVVLGGELMAYVSKVDGNPNGTGDAEFMYAAPSQMLFCFE